MEFMERRILRDGKALDQNILLVDSFLNHQVDMALMQEVGNAFAHRYRDEGITRVVTIESSGIAPAGMAALALRLPLVVLKKRNSRITSADVYQTSVQSFTKNTQYELTVARRFLPAGERVLFIDDFLAMGEAALGVMRILDMAGCALAGVGIVIEKSFQPGRQRIEEKGHEVFSLARIAQMSAAGITFIPATEM